MTMRKLGRGEEAKSALEQLRSLLTDEESARDPEVNALLAETKELIAGKRD
jgi:hypothetical protein